MRREQDEGRVVRDSCSASLGKILVSSVSCVDMQLWETRDPLHARKHLESKEKKPHLRGGIKTLSCCGSVWRQTEKVNITDLLRFLPQ